MKQKLHEHVPLTWAQYQQHQEFWKLDFYICWKKMWQQAWSLEPPDLATSRNNLKVYSLLFYKHKSKKQKTIMHGPIGVITYNTFPKLISI